MSDREVIALKAEVRALRALVEALEERVRVLESNSFEVITPTAESPRQAFTPPPRTHHTSSLPSAGSRGSPSGAASGSVAADVPGPPDGPFRQEIASEVGRFLGRALRGEHRGTSGRDRLALPSRYYIVLVDYQGTRLPEPAIFYQI